MCEVLSRPRAFRGSWGPGGGKLGLAAGKHSKDWRGLLLFDMKVREWLLKRYGRRVNPELIAELDHAIRRLQALAQRTAS